ncbi:mRNA decay activator protein ZFP36L2-A-like [Haliotis asinina]|uniref:mRNA decay activator protein ZFP36L2-A-like n=1 Tax=Haliotis asinina TaxID=109174 RepID=UPI0035324756
MSATLMSSFYDVGDLFQNRRNNQMKSQVAPASTDRRIVGSASLVGMRNRNFSTGSSSAFVPVTGRGSSQNSLVPGSNMLISQNDTLGCGITSVTSTREHKKLDRSLSEPVGSRTQGGGNINSSRYKTEMCRPFEESGHCKYGDKCQFAHGIHELRNLARHPKYKTELCRTFHTIGFCPYGPRCHFIHNEDERKLNQLVNKNQQANSVVLPTSVQQPTPIERPKSIKFTSLGSSFDSPPSSSTGSPTNLSPTLSGDIFSYSAFHSGSSSSTSSRSSDSCRSSPVFNYSPVSDIIDSTTPLNVQTQLNINVNVNNSAMDFTTMQFNSVLNLNQRNDNQQTVFEDNLLDLCTSLCSRDTMCANDVFATAPPSSPESISGDSIGSIASQGSSSYGTCGSPLDVGKSLRLPFFNQLSIDGK